MNLSELVAAANEPFTSRYRNRLVNGEAGSEQEPRFELYHAAPSLCSMKVRTVLAEKRLPYYSHDLNLMIRKAEAPECYRPGYVRLRLEGAPDAVLASGYTGQSSMTTEGFDPCVVPTLVDHETERVVVDSAKICAYIDEHSEGERLIPEALSNEVGAQIALVDQAPHVAVLYGAHPDGDVRPPALGRNIAGVHAKKIAAIEGLKAQASGDEKLTAAYDSKIAKEAGGADFMLDADRMREAHRAMDAHVAELEDQLASHAGPWALGERFTMADVMWTVSLFRMKWLGIGGAWEENASRRRVRGYVERAFERPSFRAGVFDWPGAYPPSPHVPEMSGLGATIRFVLEMFRRSR
ncbi:MAG: glutathione S-transferase family protein [Gammaproteobacteria bacterium]|nr:glutathione S-transferase family protein [Gammaproteobacteria bacterium]